MRSYSENYKPWVHDDDNNVSQGDPFRFVYLQVLQECEQLQLGEWWKAVHYVFFDHHVHQKQAIYKQDSHFEMMI